MASFQWKLTTRLRHPTSYVLVYPLLVLVMLRAKEVVAHLSINYIIKNGIHSQCPNDRKVWHLVCLLPAAAYFGKVTYCWQSLTRLLSIITFVSKSSFEELRILYIWFLGGLPSRLLTKSNLISVSSENRSCFSDHSLSLALYANGIMATTVASIPLCWIFRS